jgi:redox-sensitive bicupin YhaK (pirin superfamily)
MSSVFQIKGHTKDLGGGFQVRRLLPSAQRQSVGPFVFFDHFGPVEQRPQDNHDVRAHPHIGLATVTYLFEGAMMHRDSVGSVQRIEPGAINWMTAGRGIVHSERTPADLRNVTRRSHGIQLWAALPPEYEEVEPSFEHTPASVIPAIRVGDVEVRVLIGEAFGVRSPVATLMPTLYLDLHFLANSSVTLHPNQSELACYSTNNSMTINNEPLANLNLAICDSVDLVISAEAGTRCVVIGGERLAERRHMWWNFVSTRRERIAKACDDWEAQRIGQVPGETEFVPLPERKFAV